MEKSKKADPSVSVV